MGSVPGGQFGGPYLTPAQSSTHPLAHWGDVPADTTAAGARPQGRPEVVRQEVPEGMHSTQPLDAQSHHDSGPACILYTRTHHLIALEGGGDICC